ncbi:MAG TPA: EstA protein, partial [Desulfobacteraceae bacterium]|nr:EstA protein [Desulfobacteraceae bacterium]
MNRLTFELSSYTLKTFSGFSRASVKVEGQENIPEGAVIFCANHFTRIETVFLPYHIHAVTGKQVWSLAAAELFKIPVLEGLMRRLGGVSTHDPLRDQKILNTLLSSKIQWVIFPEGMMVKNKKRMRPHTGAAVQAFRCEFFRERLRRHADIGGKEFLRLKDSLGVDDLDRVLSQQTYIVPVNITYYPANPRENILAAMAKLLMKEPSPRLTDELMTEGAMLFVGVDITIRFGAPIAIRPYLNDPYIESMLTVRRQVRFDQDIYSKSVSKQIAGRIMERYMADVYAMTTLNYDHVMACILKHYPYKREGIDIYAFKCKVYYAVTCLLLNRLCYVSDNFRHNLIHLLINDRYDRVARFLALAQRTGVVRIDGARMFKDQTRFYDHTPFHSIRLENPVVVMANEVEPVTEAEICLKKIAQKSDRQIYQSVRSRLIEKINVDYAKAYKQFYVDGESKRKRVGRPLFLKRTNEVAGVLLIHGYMAAPREMADFAEYLHTQGFTVYAPRLAGHGTSPENLA